MVAWFLVMQLLINLVGADQTALVLKTSFVWLVKQLGSRLMTIDRADFNSQPLACGLELWKVQPTICKMNQTF